MYGPCVEQAQSSSIQATDDSQLVGAPVPVPVPAVVSVARNSPATTSEADNVISSGEKRKRGRPPRGAAVKAPPQPRQREVVVEEEEDVCFICFDGGSLVLCDRKGCPKAYHPACIKRDEAFFQSNATWTCGWHICSVCQKTSHYMCYTCTYSVCKGCIKNADYFCVRRNKGFCSTCMRVIMLIENIDQESKEMVQVDFDDKRNWEYLFKVYWMYLKEKLSLTQSELIQAKNSWKESGAVHAKRKKLPFDHLELKKPKELLEPPYNDTPSTEIRTISESENLSGPGCTPIELEIRSKDSLKTEEGSIALETSLKGQIEWASKEFLELVAHMKNGDTSARSNLDVQALLLEYIKKHNLRDPRQKSQIICDSRLKSLFGKPRVGHIEMLKLLEYHVLIKEDPQKSAFIAAGIVGTVTSHVEADDNNDISFLNNKTKKRKSNRNSDEKSVQINLDEYAAIDAHNINLIYLRRDLMENLIEDMEKFHGRVIGSIVRIRIPSNDQKQEMYRLVHVIGTSKASVPYKLGDKTADVLVEVLNLNKKEAIPIDSISNQDFSEEECRRLRQIIKCGIIKSLTIGEIQKKAMELRAVKLKDSLEAEILRLNHLRDRASEKGRKKELRECVEKLELLNTPEEHQRRLLAIPEVHVDPKMDPNCESEEESDDKKQVEFGGPRCTRFNRREDKLFSSWRKAKEGSTMARCKTSEKIKAHGNNAACQAVDRSTSETSIASLSTLNSISSKNSETEQVWHYRDPSSRIQGPFSVMQLRKWNRSGLFPPDMRIWTNDEYDDSVLLRNALNGLFQKAPRVHGEISNQSQDHSAASVNSSVASMGGLSSSFPRCLDLNSSYSDKPEASSAVPSPSHGDVHEAPPDAKICHAIVDFQSSTGHVVQDSSGSTMSPISDGGCNYSNRSPVNMNTESSFASVTKSNDSFEQKCINHFPDLPSPTPKTSYDDVERQAAEKLLSLSSGVPVQSSDIQDLPSPTPKLKDEAPVEQAAANNESFPSNFPVQDSGSSGSSASSLVIGGAQLPEITNEWVGYTPAAKPSVDSGLVSDSLLKPAEALGDHVDTPTSDADPLNHTSSSQPVSNFSYWQELFGEPIELSTLDEESVSDLLAEVDAMASQTRNGMGSPTSAMKRSDCFISIEELSPMPDPAKNDALSSTEDIQLPCASTFDPLKRSGGNSSPSSEGETKSADVSFPQWEAGSNALTPCTTSRTGLESITTGNMAWCEPVQGFANVSDVNNMGTAWGNSHMNHTPFPGNPVLERQFMYTGEMSGGSRDWVVPVGDLGFGSDRLSWNGQPFGGGGHSGPPPKGQRVCDCNENGHCKNGASCSYLHL